MLGRAYEIRVAACTKVTVCTCVRLYVWPRLGNHRRPLVRGVGPLVRGVGSLLRGIGALLRGVGLLVRGVGPVLRGIGSLVRGIGSPREFHLIAHLS